MGWILLLAALAAGWYAITPHKPDKKPKPTGARVGSFIVAVVLFSCSLGVFFGGDDTSNTTATAATTDAPESSDAASTDAAADPTDPPAESPQQQKHDLLQEVDESISGARIAGNPYKYVGDAVDLHCTVDSIPDESYFNADCGTDDEGMTAIIVVQHDTTGLDKGQAVRVIGRVVDPIEGTNAMGGEMKFPTVEAQFME